jgi:hypothetical protein
MNLSTHRFSGRHALVAATLLAAGMLSATVGSGSGHTATDPGRGVRQHSTLDDEYRKMVNHGSPASSSTVDLIEGRKTLDHSVH